jgi:hypothetical protein
MAASLSRKEMEVQQIAKQLKDLEEEVIYQIYCFYPV